MNIEEARSIWRYDDISGDLFWTRAVGGKSSAGARAGTKDSEGYTVVRYLGKGYKAHRIAWLLHYGVAPAEWIDHVNGCKSDNRICNLRLATGNLNHMNVWKSNGRSGLRGVSWFSQYQKWKATIQHNGKTIFLGHYPDKDAAYFVYLSAKAALTNGVVPFTSPKE